MMNKMSKKKKNALMLATALTLIPAVGVSTISCKSAKDVFNQAFEEAIILKGKQNAKKITTNYLIDQFNKIDVNNEEAKKTFLEQYIDGLPTPQNKHTTIKIKSVGHLQQGDTSNSFPVGESLLISFEFKVKNEVGTKFARVSGFRSQKALEKLFVEEAFNDDNFNIDKKELEMSKVSAQEAVRNIISEGATNKYFKIRTNNDDSNYINVSNSKWIKEFDQTNDPKKDPSYISSQVKVVTNWKDPENIKALNETDIQISLNLVYQNESLKKDFVIEGFKNVSQEFNNKVDNVSLYANAIAYKKLVTEVDIQNLSQYIIGIPQSSSEFNVMINSVKPVDETEDNDKVEIKITYSNPLSNQVKPRIETYIVSGFKTLAQQNDEDVDSVMEKFTELNFVVNANGKNVLPSTINKDNLLQYVIVQANNPINGVNWSCIEVPFKSDDFGSITAKFEFVKGTIKKTKSLNIQGFLTTRENDKNHVDIMYKKGLNLSLKPDASTVLASSINLDNYDSYIQGFPSIENDVERIISFIPNDEQGTLTIRVQYRKGEIQSETLERILSGFKNQSSIHQDEVNEAKENFGNLVINDFGRKIYIKSVTKTNIVDYVSGFPWEVGTTNGQGISLSISAINIKRNSNQSSTYNSKTITVSIKLQKVDAVATLERDVVGFISEEENDTAILNDFISSINLGIVNAQTSLVTPDSINTGNYETYITGLNVNNDKGVFITIKNIRPKSNDFNNKKIIMDLVLRKGNITKEIQKEVGDFLSNWDAKSNELSKLVDDAKTNVNLKITELGKETITSKVDAQNINQYVTGIPQSPGNGIYVKVENVLQGTNDKEIVVYISYNYDFSQNNTISTVTVNFSKTVSGFRTVNEQNKIDIEKAAQNQPPLAITELGTKTLASKVTIINFNQYVSGILSQEQNNNILTTISSLSVDEKNDQILNVKLMFSKGSQQHLSSKTYQVIGFKSVNLQNQEDVNAEYEKNKNVVLAITNAGKKETSSIVNNKNIDTYISGIPYPDSSSGITLVFDEIDTSIDSQVRVSFHYKKGKSVSSKISKTISGFLRLNEKDKLDVQSFINSGWNLAITPAGTNVSSQTVNSNNYKQYINGFPISSNGVTMSIDSFNSKSNELTDPNNRILIVTMTFRKGTYSETIAREVAGFATPSESEMFDYIISKLVFEANELGKNTTSYYITNNEKANNTIGISSENDSHIGFVFTYSNFRVNDEDGTSLKVDIQIQKTDQNNNVLSKTITDVEINGFKSRAIQTEENYNLQINQLSNVTPKNNVNRGNVLSKYIYDDKTRIYTYFNIPKTLDWINVSYNVYYVGNDKSLSNTGLKIVFTVKNTLTNKSENVTILFEGFKDPYSDKKFDFFTLDIWATRENTGGAYSNAAVTSEGILEANWQASWVSKGWREFVTDYNSKTENNKKAGIAIAEAAVKQHFGPNSSVKYRFYSLTFGDKSYGVGGGRQINSYYMWGYFTEEGYPEFLKEFKVQAGSKSMWW